MSWSRMLIPAILVVLLTGASGSTHHDASHQLPGYDDGYSDGHEQGYEEGYATGYEDGFRDGQNASMNGGGSEPTPHPAMACSTPYHVQGAGWDICWQQDDLRVQGLEINRAFFHGQSVAWKMGLPFSLTKYDHETAESSPLLFATGPFKDALGTPDSAGLPGFGRGSLVIDADACPRFFGHGELLNGGRICLERRGGVSPAMTLWARYDAFNYRFLQGWTFDDRGTIEPFLAMGGHLLDGTNIGAEGLNHFHHIYWRIDLDVGRGGNDTFQSFLRGAGELYPLPQLSNGAPDIVREGVADAITASTGCQEVGDTSSTYWCDVARESKHLHQPAVAGKWRVADPNDTNQQGRARSMEFVAHSDAQPDQFSTFDTLVLQHAGDSTEIGHEVPSVPTEGDRALDSYMDPPEAMTDPVAWLVHHTYHDTRDEDRGTMSLHFASLPIRPRNLVDDNPGEATFP